MRSDTIGMFLLAARSISRATIEDLLLCPERTRTTTRASLMAARIISLQLAPALLSRCEIQQRMPFPSNAAQTASAARSSWLE